MNYIEISLTNIKENIKTIKSNYPNYKYHMAVVKSEAYGLGLKAIKTISENVDYLVVSTMDEAIKIRKYKINSPILVLNPIEYKDKNYYLKYNITATIDNEKIANKLRNSKIKVHIKINTGMNRYGIANIKEFENLYNTIKNSDLFLEGIYTHLYFSCNKDITNNQVNLFKQFINIIDYKSIPMIHLYQSESLITYPKLNFDNALRIGDLIYGICEKKEENLKSTFSLLTKIIKINHLNINQTASYDQKFKATKDCYIAVLPIGYSSGIPKNHVGTSVYINNNFYKIVDIVMNATFVEVDDKIKVNDEVHFYKDINHIIEVSHQLNTVPQEPMTILDKNIKKKYLDN